MFVALSSLFLAGLLSATLLPGASELLFVQQVLANPSQGLWLCLAVTAGNSVGGAITFFMGVGLARVGSAWKLAQRLRVQPPSPGTMANVQRYGRWLLLFSWLPVVGDAWCLAAGMLGWSWRFSLALIVAGKAARYSVLLLAIT